MFNAIQLAFIAGVPSAALVKNTDHFSVFTLQDLYETCLELPVESTKAVLAQAGLADHNDKLTRKEAALLRAAHDMSSLEADETIADLGREMVFLEDKLEASTQAEVMRHVCLLMLRNGAKDPTAVKAQELKGRLVSTLLVLAAAPSDDTQQSCLSLNAARLFRAPFDSDEFGVILTAIVNNLSHCTALVRAEADAKRVFYSHRKLAAELATSLVTLYVSATLSGSKL